MIKMKYLPLLAALAACGAPQSENSALTGANALSTNGFMSLLSDEGMSIEGPIVRHFEGNGDIYNVGGGIADITGPASGKMMMGYFNTKQKTAGVHLRLWSRAFVIADQASGKRIVLVTADLCHLTIAIKQQVIAGLKKKFGNIYGDENVLLASTHTHTGPGGYSHYKFYNIASFGFSPDNLAQISSGIVESIEQAHNNLEPATIKVANVVLEGASVNRSLPAYEANPAEERAQYKTDTNKLMTVLRFDGVNGNQIGMLNWFGVHATVVERDNLWISGDNKGYAAYKFERDMGRSYRNSKGFVAAFANAEAGDVSPNYAKDVDGDGDWDCPENTNMACLKDSGGRQLNSARKAYDEAKTPVRGAIDYRHTYVDMSRVKVGDDYTHDGEKKTCYAAIGMSMLAGAPEDGPGVGQEGRTCGSLGPVLGSILCRPTYDYECHGVKPIVVKTGSKKPTPWTPEILPLQIVRIGQLALAALPGEFTTMSGRRIRGTVQEELKPAGVEQVVLAAYSNAYAGYIATPQEYQLQFYEGASTHFGPWTQPAYQQEMQKVASAMATGAQLASSIKPRDLTGEQLDGLAARPPLDNPGAGKKFGQVLADAKPAYRVGESVKVTFVGTSLNNYMDRGKPHAWVEKLVNGQWAVAYYDWDMDTILDWQDKLNGVSETNFIWNITNEAQPGTYRMRYVGRARVAQNKFANFSATSKQFEVK